MNIYAVQTPMGELFAIGTDDAAALVTVRFTALAAVGLAVGAVLVEAIEAAANEILWEIR